MELANIFPSKYIKAADLQGREPTVIIDRAEIDTIGEDRKLVLYFRGKDKGLVTNRTNADRIGHLYGSNTDGWVGREIVLFCDMVNFQGKVVEAIRVRAPARRDPITTGPQRAAETSERDRQPPMRPIDNGPSDEIPF